MIARPEHRKRGEQGQSHAYVRCYAVVAVDRGSRSRIAVAGAGADRGRGRGRGRGRERARAQGKIHPVIAH